MEYIFKKGFLKPLGVYYLENPLLFLLLLMKMMKMEKSAGSFCHRQLLQEQWAGLHMCWKSAHVRNFTRRSLFSICLYIVLLSMQNIQHRIKKQTMCWKSAHVRNFTCLAILLCVICQFVCILFPFAFISIPYLISQIVTCCFPLASYPLPNNHVHPMTIT